MKKINIMILILFLFLFQGCIFQNQPPIIKSMKPGDGEKINPGETTFEWDVRDPEEDILKYNFYLYSNGILKKKIENLVLNYLKVDLEENTKYHWTLEAIDIKGNRVQKEVSFETIFVNSKPIKSFLQYPADNENDVYPYNVTFKWNKSVDFDGDTVFYDLYISESSQLTTPIATNLLNTEYTIDKLKLGALYYWKVVSHDTFGASNTSETWKFKTADNTSPTIDFPQKDFIVKENEEFELDLSNFISDMEDNYFEYSIVTNNGASIQGNKYIFKPGYNFVKHPNLTRKIQEQIIVSDTKDNSSGLLNIIVEDVNQNPEKPEILYPLNNSIVPKDIQIKWNCIDLDNDNLKYDIYLGNYSGNYTKIATDISSKEYNLNLNYNTNYYLKIVAKDIYGGIKSSDEIYFMTKKEEKNLQWEKDISNIKDIFIYNNRLIVVSENKIYKLNTNGTECCSLDLSGVRSNSVIFDNLIYIPLNGGIIQIVNLNNFEIINTINVPDEIIGITLNKDYQNRKYLYVITDNGNIFVYTLENYSLYWSKNYNLLPNAPILVIKNGYLVISGNNGNEGKIIIVKPKGEIFKEINLSQNITSLVSNDENYNIYFSVGNKIYSYSMAGIKNWELSLSENPENEIIYDGENFYASSKDKIFKIDKEGNLIDTYIENNIYSKSLLITENKNLIIAYNNGIIQNENKLNLENFGEIITYALLNDGILYFASENKLYAISIEDKNILSGFWSKFGKNIFNNRESYIRNNTAPKKPELIYPQNQSVEIPVKLELEWQCEDMEDDELSYDIYLGKGENLEFITTTHATSYVIELENNKKYYWKIISNDGELSSESDIYSFNTIPSPASQKFKVKVEGATIFSPVISDENIIYFSTSSGKVYSYDSSGNKIWEYNTNGFINSSVVLNPLNQIIIGNENGELYIINSDGTLTNKVILNGAIKKPVALGNNSEIFVVTDIGMLYKLGAFGNKIWNIKLNGYPTTNIVIDYENNLYFGLNNYLYSYDENGNLRFKISFSTEITTYLSMDNNENVYFAVNDKIYAINKYGIIEFEKNISQKIIGSILIDNNNAIVFESNNGNIFKYYYISDTFEKINIDEQLYSLILMENTKYITTKNKFIVYNGELKWFDEYKKIKYSPNIDVNGVIIFGNTEGYLYGVYGESNYLRNSPWPIYLGDKKHTGNINKNINIPENRPPLKPYNPYPQDGSEISLTSITLTWESSDPDGDNVYYNLYFDSNNNPNLLASNLNQNSYQINNLTAGTYYWYIEAIDEKGNISKSSIWSFVIKEGVQNNPPLKPNLLEPLNNANNISNNVVLKWQCSDPDGDTLKYDVYINTEPILSTPIETDYTNTTYSMVLDTNTTYYWKVVAKDGKGGETSSDIYSFTTSEEINNPPNKPILLEPLNNTTNVEPNVTLSWSATDPDGDTLTYDLYFGKSSNFTVPYKKDLKTTTMYLTDLELGATYYWKVVAKDGKGGENSSDIYKFTVKDSIGPLTPKLYFKDTTIPSGGQGELIIHGQKLENVLAFDIEIKYDNTKLSVSESDIQFIGELTGRNLIVNINNGKLKITTLSFSPFNVNNSDIIKITFTAIGSSGNTELRFTDNTKIVDSNGKELEVDTSDVGIISIQ
ncbi:hypothetical protein JCM30566_07090 [Marinitoga arctica]